MKSKRRRHDPEFKARVALEALQGIKTIQQIAKGFDIHPVQVSDGKKTMAEGAAGIFQLKLRQRRCRRFRPRTRPAPRQNRPTSRRIGLANKKVQTTRTVRKRVELVYQKHPKITMRNRLPSAMARHGATRPKPRQADVSLTTPAFDYSSRATTILTPKP
jgi:transposase-like protein